jgi:2-polyprenyl-3-methyl-5-hydroxy-6-metoxy-1,4-benzoquinol methylase
MSQPTNQDVIQRWSVFASDHYTDQGDFAREQLLNPAIFALLGSVEGKRMLDAGCGQGYLCRLLTDRGANVTGLEPSTAMFRSAVEREERERRGIQYVQADLSSYAIEAASFDAVVANMVLMDIPEWEAATQTCMRALRPGGDFVFSPIHPCFEESSTEWGKGYVAVPEYLDEYVVEQPVSVRFHRPLSWYLNLVIDGGCAIRRLIEPQLGPE